MSNSEYVAGQRWVSATEPELGLGVVESVDARRVDLLFPAADEHRIYAIGNAPLSRVEYALGDRVNSRVGEAATVVDKLEHGGKFIYLCVDEGGQELAMPEIELDASAQFSKPQDRLFAGQIDNNAQFDLRVETLLYYHRQRQFDSFGLLGPRVQILPHQFYIANDVANRFAPRVLLADEVGLGKTIEAGLIIHRQLLLERIHRVLVVVPDALIHQWLVEMLRRFNLRFTILDADRCTALEESGEVNAFDTTQLALCPLSLFVNEQQQLDKALAVRWDMLVVDEAHHLDWSEDSSTPAYDCIARLAEQTLGLLLLTATPEQLGNDGHFARLRLLDPARYHSLQAFRDEEAGYREIGTLVEQLDQLRDDATSTPDNDLTEQLSRHLGAELGSALTEVTAENRLEVISQLTNRLLDRHGTGRVLFRNTRDTIGGFPARRLCTYPLAPLSTSSPDDGSLALYPEQSMNEDWVNIDTRVSWLCEFLQADRTRKVLVICALAQTARDLEQHLRLRAGIRSAVFHEDLALVARDRAAAYFADDDESAQTLVCSEIGSEGRNFQFAHDIVLFDLPRNPDLLEQRIGRLDRIGQSEDIKIHVPYFERSATHVLLSWYHEGFNAFEKTAPAGEKLLSEFEHELDECLLHYDESAKESLVHRTREKAAELQVLMTAGRNRLLERHSFDPVVADEIVQAVAGSAHRLGLSDYLERLLDQFGIEHQPLSNQSLLIRPSEQMVLPSFPGLPEDGLSATFERSLALVRDDLNFLTWEHPLVFNAMELMIGGEYGNNAFCTVKLPKVAPGTLLIETIFSVFCPAPKHLQIQQFLNQGISRFVVDINDNDLSETYPRDVFQRLTERVARRMARDVVKHARPDLQRMLITATDLASQARQTLIDEAEHLLMEKQLLEAERLTALAAVNPNIRQEEIDHLRESHTQRLNALQNTQMKLDALRVAVAT